MIIAVPEKDGKIDGHFGHCDHYRLFAVDEKKKAVISEELLPSPSGCGCKSNIGPILNSKGVSHMLAGSIGQGAINALGANGIAVVAGCSGDTRAVVNAWLDGTLSADGTPCDHHDDGCGHS